MAKKNKREAKRPDGPAKPLAHNPFAALAAVSAPPGPKPEPAEPSPEPAGQTSTEFASKVVVRREKKGRGGKTVTRVSGLNQPAQVLPRMKRALGCGATVEGDDLILLGNVGDRAAKWLEAQGASRVVRGS